MRVSSVESVSCARVGCGVTCTVVWWCLLVLVCVGTQCVPGVATRVRWPQDLQTHFFVYTPRDSRQYGTGYSRESERSERAEAALGRPPAPALWLALQCLHLGDKIPRNSNFEKDRAQQGGSAKKLPIPMPHMQHACTVCTHQLSLRCSGSLPVVAWAGPAPPPPLPRSSRSC